MTTETIAILGVGVAMLSVVAAFGALILTSLNRMEARINRRIDDVIADNKAEFAASEARFNGRLDAIEVRFEARLDASEARVANEFNEIKDKLDAQAVRMSGIEQRQARLEGLLDGLREALFQRVQQ